MGTFIIIELVGKEELLPGQSQSFFFEGGMDGRDVAAVTAWASRLGHGGAESRFLTVDKVWTEAITDDGFTKDTYRLHCTVTNNGSTSVPTYSVNAAIMSP